MKDFILYLFTMLEEDKGMLSISRVMYAVGGVYAMAMGAWIFHVTGDWKAVAAAVPALAGVFVAQRIVQKGQELKVNQNDPDL